MNNPIKIKVQCRLPLYLLVFGFSFLLAHNVLAQAIIDAENYSLFRLLREISIFLNVVLIILVIVLAISLRGALKYLGGSDTVKNKLKLIFSFISKEPALIFSQISKRDPNGTYQLPFEKYRQMHIFSRKTFLRTLGLVALQVMLIVFMIYALNTLTNYTKAKGNTLLQSPNFKLQLDK